MNYKKAYAQYDAALIEKNGVLWCERCGTTSRRLHHHHIVYRSEKPNHEHLHDLRNLILVCDVCHDYYHESKSNRVELIEARGLVELFGEDIKK